MFLVALNGFFVAAEFAYVRVRATAVESMVDAGKPGAETLDAAMDSLDDYLAVTQLGITLASLGLGWIGEPAVAALIEPVLGGFLPQSLVHLVAFAVGFSVITFLHVVFGELAPKTIAIAQAERIALLVAAPMRVCHFLFYPGLVVFNGTANAFTRALGVPPASETDETLTEEELRMALARAGEEGHVAGAEVEMVESVFELDDVSVREAMVPRPDVRTVTTDLPLSELRAVIVDAGHTRYPVVAADDPDRVAGVVDAKDVIRAGIDAAAAEADGEGEPAVTAGDLARDLHAVPETTSVADLLADLQKRRTQMAAVIDEWGAFEGIVTIEDLVEVIVGDIRDEFDAVTTEPAIDRREDGSLAVGGAVRLAELDEELGTALDAEWPGIDTIGGLVADQLGRPPEDGDAVTVDGHTVEVTDVDGMRVETVVVRRADADEGQTDREDGEGEADSEGGKGSDDATGNR
ncbi:hemolysin family protein [Haloparvum sedimenti]|uniref:hemolysin family protein n=1 Tax=Haloparvum sedimenti TaxID=1678448 RepID=UPI001FE1CAAC|nr:hemolysin family protein [Haloparvum sedimenti]